MKNKLLEDKKLLNTIVNKIASIIGDIDKRSVEKQLVCSLLKENDIVATKNNVYVKRYDKGCNPIGISVSPSVDITKTFK